MKLAPEPILFLVHRIPFPPNKGDKIRSYHLLRHLSARYLVHLGTFIDSPDDAAYVEKLDELCASHCVLSLNPMSAKLRSAQGFLTGEPLTLPYYRRRRLRRWIEQTVAVNDIRKAVVFSAAMAQYVDRLPDLHVVLDLVDVDSAKWMQYSARHAWPLSTVYQREGKKLLSIERKAAGSASSTVFVTRSEADLFVKLAPEFSGRLKVIENGVDTAYFAPAQDRPSPYAAEESAIVFTGVMDYLPNIDAVTWFSRAVFPNILQHRPDARFYIVGMNPVSAVMALAADSRIVVTGKVADVRPYVQHAAAVVAPLRVARGIQNKILEAMAMARPVVVSAAASTGLSATAGVDFESAGDSDEFCRKLLAIMQPVVGEPMGARARRRIVANYNWERNLSAFKSLLEPQPLHRNDASLVAIDAH